MKIVRCRTNHMKNPLGFWFEQPVISWTVTETLDKKQETARIVVALDAQLNKIIYDTGKDNTLSGLGTPIPIELLPFTRYYWQVSVWGDGGDEGVSKVSWFETGRRDAPWKSCWITPAWEDNAIHPYIWHKFILEQPVISARAYAVGVGMYELMLNGSKVGNEYFAPGCTVYEKGIQCYTYDITKYLGTGENVIGAILGNGWAKGRFGVFGPDVHSQASDRFALRMELRITLLDGSEMEIGTDEDWKCIEAPVIADSLYDGEIYDARKEISGGQRSEFNLDKDSGTTEPGNLDKGAGTLELDNADLDAVRRWDPENLGRIVDRLSLPVCKKETVKPVSLFRTKKNELVLDMGQNLAGGLAVRIHEPCGTRLKFSFGEVLQDDCFYNENLRSAKQEYIYIANGEERIAEPHFVFYGFRYVKLEGFTKEPVIEDFTGYAMYSDLEETGQITTSDPQVNQLFENAKWSQRGNFVDVPTDCPQRDERMGWTGDAQVFSETASYNMETYEFYTKYLQDLWNEQKLQNGMVGNIIPSFTKRKTDVSDPIQGGSAAWGDAAVIIPWRLYLHYGDITILKRQYESMKAWVDWIRRQDEADGSSWLWRTGFQFGDWLALDGRTAGGTQGGTDKVYIASAYYSYSADLVSKSAKVLGFTDDEEYYRELSKRVKQAILNEYFSPNGRLTIKTQTAYILALYMELIPKEWETRVVEDLARRVEEDNMHLTTGFVGTPYLCRVLSAHGYADHAYRIFFQEDYPGWLYEIRMGATTIWERWNSILPDGRISDTGLNSLNHYAYGSIVEWLYQSVCGLQIQEQYPGFKQFVIKPTLCNKLKYAQAAYQSPAGYIFSRWEVADNKMQMNITIPFDAKAAVYLPCPKPETIVGIDSQLLQEASGGYRYADLPAGEYQITYDLQWDAGECYSFDYSVNEMVTVPEAADVLYDLTDRIGIMSKELSPDLNKPLSDALKEMDPAALEQIRELMDLEQMERRLQMIPVRRIR
ncbi:family 78 glycoside hydrolase catalytic domain [Robinsoniella peoriensis]|uniref:alpha-L-rhamnosidase n=1 Tax=Robinsoniella peoriensis TaxID=180332 RepID=UPI003753E0B8